MFISFYAVVIRGKKEGTDEDKEHKDRRGKTTEKEDKRRPRAPVKGTALIIEILPPL